MDINKEKKSCLDNDDPDDYDKDEINELVRKECKNFDPDFEKHLREKWGLTKKEYVKNQLLSKKMQKLQNKWDESEKKIQQGKEEFNKVIEMMEKDKEILEQNKKKNKAKIIELEMKISREKSIYIEELNEYKEERSEYFSKYFHNYPLMPRHWMN